MKKLTKRASVSTPNLALPPSHLGSLQPIWLLTVQDAAVPIAATREVLGSSHSAILICSIVRNCVGSDWMRNPRLRLNSQSAIKRNRVKSAGKAILHVVLHIYPIGRRCAIVLARASGVTAGSCGVLRIAI
jgi:hypothetical protein